MPRNIVRDNEREIIRRRQLLEAGFKLFSRYGIERVKLQQVADETGVGIATLYKYYQNKVNLVIEISTYLWKNVWDEYNQRIPREQLNCYNSYQIVESYIDLIITIYKEQPEILRFSGFFKTYMNIEDVARVDNMHLNALKPISDLFHTLYEKAKEDNSIRTDIDEQELFTALAISMLGIAERYALGIVWAGHDDNNYLNELLLLKNMMLSWLIPS